MRLTKRLAGPCAAHRAAHRFVDNVRADLSASPDRESVADGPASRPAASLPGSSADRRGLHVAHLLPTCRETATFPSTFRRAAPPSRKYRIAHRPYRHELV